MAWWLSRIRRPWGNRIALPREPGCGFPHNFALDLELSIFLAKLRKLFMLGGRQAAAAAPGVQIGLLDPVANRLSCELERHREVMYAAARSSKLDDLLPEVRWVGVGMFSGHG